MDVRQAAIGLGMILWFTGSVAAQNTAGSLASFESPVPAASAQPAAPPSPAYENLWQDDGLMNADGCQPCFSVAVDALFLKLNRGVARGLVVDDSTSAAVLGTGDLDHDLVGGPRIALRRTLATGRILEVSYFGIDEWDRAASVASSHGLSLPGALGPATQDFSAAQIMNASLTSRINNVEVNFIRPTDREGINLLAGFRYLNLDERFNLESLSQFGGTSDYRANTANNLFGGQVGTTMNRQWGVFGLEVLGKVGIFGNDAQQRTYMTDLDSTSLLRDAYNRSGQVAFVGEIGINGTIQFTRSLYCRVGYDLIWVEGIARATDQLDFTNTAASGTDLVSDGGAFLHGFNFGVEARW
jgi:hypothetical protein